MIIFNIFYPTSTLTATCNIVIFSSIKTKINDDDELFLWYGWPTKGDKPYSSRGHYQRSLPSRISDTLRAGFEPAQNLSSGLVEWSCTVVITTAPQMDFFLFLQKNKNPYQSILIKVRLVIHCTSWTSCTFFFVILLTLSRLIFFVWIFLIINTTNIGRSNINFYISL